MLRPRVVNLDVKAEFFGIMSMNDTERGESVALLEYFFKLDQRKKLLEMAKNQLESYIINTRSALNEDNVQQVQSISKLLATCFRCMRAPMGKFRSASKCAVQPCCWSAAARLQH